MRKVAACLISLLLVTLLVGCAGSKGENTIMEVHKDGSVKSHIVEAFDQSYYDEAELQESMESDIADYNVTAGDKNISLDQFLVKDAVAKATITYASAEDYMAFNEETLFLGTIKEAKSAGYEVSVDMNAVEDTSSIQKLSSLSGDENMKLVIFSEPVEVKVYGKVLYVSKGLAPGSSDKSVTVTDTNQDLYYVIFE